MYKKNLLFIFSITIFTILSINQTSAYSDSIDHYSFDLPSEWEEIPKSAIDERLNEVNRQTNGEHIEFITGFHLTGSDYFEYPYILVQKHTLDTPSFSQIEKTFNTGNFQTKADQKISEYSELLKNATASEPLIDKEHRIIFISLKMDIVNVGKINGLMAMFLGKNSITQLNFYSTENDYSKWLPVFNSTVDSFKYEDSFIYNPEEAKKNDPPSIFEGVADEGITGVIAGGFIVLFIGLIGMLFRKGDEVNPDDEVNINMSAIKYCKECGNKIHESATICNKCKKELIN